MRGRRRGRARAALLAELLRARCVPAGWLLRATARSGARALAREAGLGRRAVAFLGAHAASFGLWLLSWWLLGRAALDGRLDPGWLVAWALVLASYVPLAVFASWQQGALAIAGGALLRRHLLRGALALEPEALRRAGAGQLLGRVIESEVVERFALAGGFLVVTAAIELLFAGWVLARGAGGLAHAALLAAFTAAVAAGVFRYARRRREWTDARTDMTDDLVERMVGQRTRVAQEPRRRWHDGEDEALERYLALSAALDRTAVRFQAIGPRGWFLVGLAGLVPAFVSGGVSASALAVGLGGVLLALGSLRNAVTGAEMLAAAAVAWSRIASLRGVPSAEATEHPRLIAPEPLAPAAGGRVLRARGLTFRYGGRAEPAIDGADLEIGCGERILVEGPSGGGKSTLGALLAGSRAPAAGVLLLDGLDLATAGARAWRRRVALVPQFHENHVLQNTLAFNLLMGRSWPARQAQLEEAERVCRALGLGPLLERMPSGLQQAVGETGWQLSHGERSRVYIAWALLQGAEVLILDESFAALDPETLRTAVAAVRELAPTLVVIAHP